MCGTCGCKSAETLSKTSCCCGADESNPCACMKAPEPMECSAKAPKCACYKALENNAETFEANSDEDNCPVCNEEVYGDMSMIGEEIVPDICGDCDIYVMPQGSDFKVRCIECGYGDFYGSRTPCESCEPIADKMEAVNNGKSAETFEAIVQDGKEYPEWESKGVVTEKVKMLEWGMKDLGFTMTSDDWAGEAEAVQFNPPFYVKAPNGKKVECQFKYNWYYDEFFVLGDYDIEYDAEENPIGIPTFETMQKKLATYGFHRLNFENWNDQNTLLYIEDFKPSLVTIYGAETFEANSDEDNCPVCNEEVYGDMSMIGEEIVPDICGDCDIYVMPQGSDFKVRCIECGYGDFYGSRTPCESCEPIADKMEAVNNGKSAETFDDMKINYDNRDRIFFIKSVDYDTDGEIENDELPQEFTIKIPSDYHYFDEDADEGDITDVLNEWISTETGFSTKGIVWIEEENNSWRKNAEYDMVKTSFKCYNIQYKYRRQSIEERHPDDSWPSMTVSVEHKENIEKYTLESLEDVIRAKLENKISFSQGEPVDVLFFSSERLEELQKKRLAKEFNNRGRINHQERWWAAETFNTEYDEEDMVYCNHCSDIVGNEKEVYGDETVEYEMANGELVCVPCYKIWMKEYKNDLDPHYSPFYAESESKNQSITSNKIGESLAWDNRILGMAGQWRNGKYDINRIRQDADIIGYTIVHEDYLEKKLDWMENGVPLGSKSTDIAEITFAGMKIYTGGDGSFPVMGMYENINDYYARTQNKPHPRANMTAKEFFDQEDYEKGRYEEKKWEYEFVEWVKETYKPAPTYYDDGSPMVLHHHVAEKIGQENIPKLLVGARLSLHNPSMPTLNRRDSKSSIWVLEVPDLTYLKTTKYKQNYRGKTEVFINTETTVNKFFSNLKAIYPKGHFREGTRNRRYKVFTIDIPSFGEYRWKCNEVMLAYDSVSQKEERRREGVKRQKDLKRYRLRQEEEMKALKERYGAELEDEPRVIDKDELMEHYVFYWDEEDDSGNIPLNYEEWYREFGDEIKYQIRNIFDAETFEAAVIRQGKAPKGAMAKAMMNQSMMEQANIEAMIQELENKVNLGLISEDDLMASLKKKFGAEYDIEVHSSEEFSKEDLEAYFADLKKDNPKLAKIIEFKVKNEEYLPKKLIESSGYDYEILEAWNDYVIDDDKYALFDPCPACEGEGWIMTSYTPATRFEPADGDGEDCGECGGSGKIDPSDYMYYDDKGEIEYAAETKKRKTGFRKCSKCGYSDHNSTNCNRLNEYEEYLKHKDEMLRQCDRAIDDFTSSAKRYSEEGEYGMAKMLRSDATDMKKLKRMIEKNHFGKATHFAMGMDSQPRDMAPSALWLFDAEN